MRGEGKIRLSDEVRKAAPVGSVFHFLFLERNKEGSSKMCPFMKYNYSKRDAYKLFVELGHKVLSLMETLSSSYGSGAPGRGVRPPKAGCTARQLRPAQEAT
jgi:hypothetical protein